MKTSRFNTMWLTGLLFLLAGAATGQESSDYAGYLRVMNGPMIGAVGPDHALIWVRGSYSLPLEVEYADNFHLQDSKRSAVAHLSKEEDYCATIRVEGLKPDTRYYYRILVEGKPDKYLGAHPPRSFKTAPGDGFKGIFRVAFGSCARYQYDRVQEIWSTIPPYRPDLFFWLGDIIYGDSLDPDILAEEYRRQREVPACAAALRELPQLAIWDDHDYGLNDFDRRNPVKAQTLEVFRQYWPNPSFGTPETPGVFFAYRYGGIDFFFLDVRYHRDPNAAPDTPEKTHLGTAQFAWLQDELRRSTAPFKIILSGGGWSTVKGPGGDSWSGYRHERNRLFDFIRDEAIAGVVLLSGDTHSAELNVIPRAEDGGYDLYDLVSSPLAQRPSAAWMGRRPQPPEARVRVPFSLSPNFGLLEFDLSAEPKLTFRVIGTDGRPVWAPFELYAQELRNGVSSWPEKVDRAARALARVQAEGLAP